MTSSSLNAAEDGHVLPEDQQSSAERPNKLRSRWSKGQGSWSKVSDNAPIEQAGSDNVGAGGEGHGQSMAAAAQGVGGAAAATEDDAMMEDMGPAGGVEELDETPKVSMST